MSPRPATPHTALSPSPRQLLHAPTRPVGLDAGSPNALGPNRPAPDAEWAEAIARRVVELLGGSPAALVDAATMAQALGVSRATVYEHAAELGARRVGGGPRPRLRFDVAEARAAWASRSAGGRSQPADEPAAPGNRRRRRPGRTGTGVPLLPIRPAEDR